MLFYFLLCKKNKKRKKPVTQILCIALLGCVDCIKYYLNNGVEMYMQKYSPAAPNYMQTMFHIAPSTPAPNQLF